LKLTRATVASACARADRLEDVAGAVKAALSANKSAVVDVAVDPDALYSFRRDSFERRRG